MPYRPWFARWLPLLLVLAACTPIAQSLDQGEPPLEPAAQARIDIAGEDLVGRDGPFTKVGFDLALLYREFEAYRRDGSAAVAAFVPSDARLRVSDGLVVVDAVASGSTEALLEALRALGLVDEATFGRRVSGRLPIAAIAELAGLGSLQSARPALATTR